MFEAFFGLRLDRRAFEQDVRGAKDHVRREMGTATASAGPVGGGGGFFGSGGFAGGGIVGNILGDAGIGQFGSVLSRLGAAGGLAGIGAAAIGGPIVALTKFYEKQAEQLNELADSSNELVRAAGQGDQSAFIAFNKRKKALSDELEAAESPESAFNPVNLVYRAIMGTTASRYQQLLAQATADENTARLIITQYNERQGMLQAREASDAALRSIAFSVEQFAQQTRGVRR